MFRRKIQQEATPSPACAATVVAPIATGVAAKEAAPIPTRRGCGHSRGPSPAATEPVEADFGTQETTLAPKREPLDGDLIRRRWRSLIGRHPPKTLSHALMDRILAWREQVAEGGDINPRSRAILAAALAGKATQAGKNGHGQDSEGKDDHGAHRHRSDAPLRIGTALVREHAGVLHRVMVVAEGFEWEGRVYASLSAVARAITSVRWNGRRFFALDRSAKQAARKAPGQTDAAARRASRGPNESSDVGGGV